jgi:nicotinamidase/pyrazinamidase
MLTSCGQSHCQNYCKSLEASGRFTHFIWPVHCLIGTVGHCVDPCINDALQHWCSSRARRVTYLHKGQNALTEHFSIFKAEVPLSEDPSTQLNTDLIEELKGYDKVLICGQALSHCVNYSFRDLAASWHPDRMQDIILLADCSSSVPGFEAAGEQLFLDAKQMGCSVMGFEDLKL